MSADILGLVRSCQQCQASKVQRHIRAPLQPRQEPDRRFGSLNVDLVGPLPESEGYRYIFTVIDRFTKWVEAVPLQSISAADCAAALLRQWISRFGVPTDITSDQGRQFVSGLWHELTATLGIKALRTTSYHPQANGLIERVHRVLKERLMAISSVPSDWMRNLPLVLMSLRASVREDVDASPADLVLGSPLRLPGQFFPAPSQSPGAPPSSDFVRDLQQRVSDLAPIPTSYHSRPSVHVSPELMKAAFVFVRVDAVKPPLVHPYEGPYRVLQVGQKTFVLDKLGKPWTVSVDRLKPAHSYAQVLKTSTVSRAPPPPPSVPLTPVPVSVVPAPSSVVSVPATSVSSRAGRVVRPPDRLNL